MKDIVIIANFVAEFDGGANSRFTYLADLLHIDNKVEIIGSDYSHGNKKPRKIEQNRFPYKVTLLHEPGYKKNICFQRFKSHKIWGENVYKYLLRRNKPDIVYCAVPSLTAASKAADYCKVNDIKFIIDIQDLWPEAFQMVFNIPIISRIIFNPFKRFVDKIYKSADVIIGVSNTYVQRAMSVNKKCKRGISVYLGTEKDTFDKYATDIKVEGNNPKIVYIGTLGKSYDIATVIDAIALLENDINCELIVIGDGTLKENFENYAKEKDIKATFLGRLPYAQMVALLTQCDIAVNPIKKGSAGSVINKVCDYAMAGLPVVNTQESPEYRDLLNQYHAGINCTCEDPVTVSKAFQTLVKNPEFRKKMGENSRRLGLEKFDRGETYKWIVNELLLDRGGGNIPCIYREL